MVFASVESHLDAMQPEEQHGCRLGRRIEEHLFTANAVIGKNEPVLQLAMSDWSVSAGERGIDDTDGFHTLLDPSFAKSQYTAAGICVDVFFRLLRKNC